MGKKATTEYRGREDGGHVVYRGCPGDRRKQLMKRANGTKDLGGICGHAHSAHSLGDNKSTHCPLHVSHCKIDPMSRRGATGARTPTPAAVQYPGTNSRVPIPQRGTQHALSWISNPRSVRLVLKARRQDRWVSWHKCRLSQRRADQGIQGRV